MTSGSSLDELLRFEKVWGERGGERSVPPEAKPIDGVSRRNVRCSGGVQAVAAVGRPVAEGCAGPAGEAIRLGRASITPPSDPIQAAMPRRIAVGEPPASQPVLLIERPIIEIYLVSAVFRYIYVRP